MEFKPFISPNQKIPELGFWPIFVGVVLGILFGASSLYLVLKVGLTVSASIPVAVLSITIFKQFAKITGTRNATILENNIVQTAGSAGESIAFGIGVTVPALLILGYSVEPGRVMVIASFGALLGILMMVPLRWALISREHGKLKFPEGTACAEVLIAGETGGSTSKTVFTGFFLGLFYKLLNVGSNFWTEEASHTFKTFKNATFATRVAPELLGVGYIIGPKVASKMVAGGILSFFVLIPAITLFGSQMTTPLYPATKLISEMKPMEIWRNYVLYIGAGAVTAGGIVSLIRTLPPIFQSLRASFVSVRASGVGAGNNAPRTERDLSMKVVLLGIAGLIIALSMTPMLNINLLGAILMVIFGFLFVTVSARLTGEIGSSSNPVSGMTVATLLLTCLVFVMMGWVGPEYRVAALSIGAVVCVASSNGGGTAQDLKTGFLVGATPRSQQIAILAGALISALVIGYTLVLLNDAGTVYKRVNYPAFVVDSSKLSPPEALRGPERDRDPGTYPTLHLADPVGEVGAGKYLVDPASGTLKYLMDPGINGAISVRDDGTRVEKFNVPKARLMSMIIDGILTQKLPWTLVLLGAFIALVMELCGVSSLGFAVGVYLPISSSTPIWFGGLARWVVERLETKKKTEIENKTSPGVLLSSGLIAGGSIAGIAIALIALKPSLGKAIDLSSVFPQIAVSEFFPYLPFALVWIAVVMIGKGSWLSEKKARK